MAKAADPFATEAFLKTVLLLSVAVGALPVASIPSEETTSFADHLAKNGVAHLTFSTALIGVLGGGAFLGSFFIDAYWKTRLASLWMTLARNLLLLTPAIVLWAYARACTSYMPVEGATKPDWARSTPVLTLASPLGLMVLSLFAVAVAAMLAKPRSQVS